MAITNRAAVDTVVISASLSTDAETNKNCGLKATSAAAKPTGRLMPDMDPEQNFGATLL